MHGTGSNLARLTAWWRGEALYRDLGGACTGTRGASCVQSIYSDNKCVGSHVARFCSQLVLNILGPMVVLVSLNDGGHVNTGQKEVALTRASLYNNMHCLNR